MGVKLSDLDPETRRKVLELLAKEAREEEDGEDRYEVVREPLGRQKKRVLRPMVRVLAEGLLLLIISVVALGMYASAKLGAHQNQTAGRTALDQAQVQPIQPVQTQEPARQQGRQQPAQQQPRQDVQQMAQQPPQQPQQPPQIQQAQPATQQFPQQDQAPVPSSLASAEPEAQAVGTVAPSPPFRAILTGKLAHYPLSNAYRIPVLVGVEKFSKPIGAKTWAELGINSVNGIIDTGAAQTCIPDWFLRQQGYQPVKGPFPISGIGKGPLNAYEYDIPPPYIWSNTDKTYVQITKSEMLVTVLGVQGYDEALIGADMLRYCSFYVAGNTWVLGVK